MAEHLLAVGIDLGGTNVTVALVDASGCLRMRESATTGAQRGPRAVVEELLRRAEQLLAGCSAGWGDVAGVGIASPGPLDLRRGRIIKAANLPGWIDVPLRDLMAEATGRPVFLDNDANAAALGEYRHAARKRATSGRAPDRRTSETSCDGAAEASELPDDLVLLTLGTGVGAGVILHGRIVHGAKENAGELGHTIVAVGGRPCPCGQRGCLEQYASAASVARRAKEAVCGGAGGVLAEQVARGGRLDAACVARAAQSGDALARRVWEETCLYLAVGIINIQHAYNPAVVLLGGGLSAAGEDLMTPVRQFLNEQQWSLCDDLPEVRLAVLGTDAGVIGAAELVWSAEREMRCGAFGKQ